MSSAGPASTSWSTLGGRTFPRRGGSAGALQAGRRRIADVGQMGRTTPPAVPRSHSRSYSDLHADDDQPSPPPPLDVDGSGASAPRGGARRADACNRTLDRHRSTVALTCTGDSDITPRACVLDCRQTKFPVYDL